MKKIYLIVFFLLSQFLLLPIAWAQSDDQIKLTITPPMIRNNVNPGQVWRSSIKLVNNNSSEIDIYVHLNDFKGGKDDGTVEFLPELSAGDEGNKALLSQWIEIEKCPIKIPAYKSVDIEFAIRVPENAEPGGHYAAILAGTQPTDDKSQGSQMKVSSLLASLILLNVQGDVEEKGMIREFSSSQNYYGKEAVDFTIKFQNSGNVHIQPQGEIRIYDMWGKDKGAIAINQGSDFGNVLPGDIRKWEYSWPHDSSLLEMGRHKAVLILGFGNQARQTVDQTMYFWVIFIKPLLIALAVVIAFISLIVLSIRYYIKQAIISTQQEAGIVAPINKVTGKPLKIVPGNGTIVNLRSKPDEEDAGDSQADEDDEVVGWSFFRNYSRAIIITTLILLGGLVYIYYQRNYVHQPKAAVKKPVEELMRTEAQIAEEKNTEEKAVDATASSSASSSQLSQIEKPKEENPAAIVKPAIDNNAFTLRIANGSGYVGAASDVDKVLYAAGYKADSLGNADNFDYQITLVKYKGDFEKEALEVSRIIGVKIETQKVEKQTDDILVIVGKNIRK
jgi:hypothetical protein